MLTMADKGGRGGLDPPFLADIICEQPLTSMDAVATSWVAMVYIQGCYGIIEGFYNLYPWLLWPISRDDVAFI